MSEKKHGSSSVHNKQLMIQYLLGELPEAAQTQLEEKFFTDNQTFEQLQIVEEQLIDDYLNNVLTQPERQKFEASYLNSERRRKKLRFARDLKTSFTPPPNFVPPAGKISIWQSRRALLQLPSVQFGVVVFGVLLFAVGLYFVAKSSNEKNQTQFSAQSSVAPVDTSATTQPTQSNDPGLKPPTQRSASAEGLQAKLQTQKKKTGALTLLSILSPGQLRDTEPNSASNKIVISPQIVTVSLQLKLTPEKKYSTYRITVETNSGQILISRNNLTKSKDGKSLVISIPAQILSTDDYVLILSGKNTRQKFIEINDYNFRVVKQ